MADKILTSRGIGQPDYAAKTAGVIAAEKPSGLYQPETQLSDLAELATRLGSPVTYDGRGDIIFLDDFRNGINRWYKTTADGTYALTKLFNTKSRSSGFCMGIGAALAWTPNTVSLYLPFVPRGKIGLELHLNSVSDKLTITMAHYDDQLIRSAALMLNSTPAYGRVLTAGSAYEQVFDSIDYNKLYLANSLSFTPIKLVADFSLETYERLLINGQSLANIAGKAIASGANTTGNKYLKIDLAMSQADGKSYIGSTINYNYVADVIVTINEPANS